MSILKASIKFNLKAFSRWGLSWGGLINNRQGEWWLAAQLIVIFAHLLPLSFKKLVVNYSWPIQIKLCSLILFLIGVILLLKAGLNLGKNLSPLPEPIQGSLLITKGEYKRCRHPIYRSLLICSLSTIFLSGSLINCILFIILCLVLKGKAIREETTLKSLHPDYKEYMHSTPAIIKGIPILDWRK